MNFITVSFYGQPNKPLDKFIPQAILDLPELDNYFAERLPTDISHYVSATDTCIYKVADYVYQTIIRYYLHGTPSEHVYYKIAASALKNVQGLVIEVAALNNVKYLYKMWEQESNYTVPLNAFKDAAEEVYMYFTDESGTQLLELGSYHETVRTSG